MKEVSTGPTRRDLQREETHRRVYLAALEIFRRDGVDACRIEDIVALAGVSRGSFYFHFPTKDDVLALAYAEAVADLVRHTDRLPDDVEIVAVLRSVVEHTAARWQGDPRIFVHVGLHALRSVTRTFPSGEREPIRLALELRFARALALGEIVSPLPPALLADIFLLSTFTALLAWSGAPQLPLAPVLDGVIGLFLHGAHGPVIAGPR
ncbi:MAG: TetR/AcrR family transcriptional regulator [Deltaproteobacteria bacterium]|nr:TetR/AcrR family transcriptional regulator [Deltaproteobacteria bacterium]